MDLRTSKLPPVVRYSVVNDYEPPSPAFRYTSSVLRRVGAREQGP